MTASSQAKGYPFHYVTCRHISASEDEEQGRKIYTGHAPTSSVLNLEDNENVREYLVDAKGKQKRSPTLVHQAIRKTLQDQPDQFSVLNSGMVIVARGATVDDKAKLIQLERPSIINGSQTQGELRRYFERANGNPEVVPNIKFEIIVTSDVDLIAEISIARNFQNDVRAISIAGRRGQLDDLELAIQKYYPDAKLRKSETDLTVDGEFLDTEKLIQVIFALLPDAMMKMLDQADPANKVFTYSQKTRCLKLFQRLVEDGPVDVYQCCLDLAPVAWSLYETWKSHQGFRGTRIRSIEREDGAIVEVPDGVIFPILAAHSAFVRLDKKSNVWKVEKPKVFDDSELIAAAKQAYMDIAGHNPQSMGKSKACYSTLITITGIYAKLAPAN